MKIFKASEKSPLKTFGSLKYQMGIGVDSFFVWLGVLGFLIAVLSAKSGCLSSGGASALAIILFLAGTIYAILA